MQNAFAQLIPVAVILISAGAFLALITYLEWQTKRANKRNPLTSDLLRGPGESLREKINDMRLDVFSYMLLMFLMPMMILAMSLSEQLFGNKPSTFVLSFYVAAVIATLGYCSFNLLRLRKRIHRHNLGLDAEIAVGQELNHLMRHGFRVYHDFPADDFNIDHVVIGPTGIFAVETKGRSKRIKDDGSAASAVIYDGETLVFPSWKEREPVMQADNQAKWLEKWISSAVGEPLSVHPVLAIPGWYITRQKAGGVPVINGKNPSGFFLKYGNSQLSEKQQQQIAHQIDRRCRTVLPKAYNKN